MVRILRGDRRLGPLANVVSLFRIETMVVPARLSTAMGWSDRPSRCRIVVDRRLQTLSKMDF